MRRGQLIATPRQSSLYEPCWIFVLSVPGQDSFSSPGWRVWLHTCGEGRRGVVHRVSSSPRLSSEGGQLLSPGVGEGLNWLGWLPYEHRRRESCKFSSFPARTRVPASAGGGQKLLLSHSCPRPCGEMRRVLTLRTQDPASLVIKTI